MHVNYVSPNITTHFLFSPFTLSVLTNKLFVLSMVFLFMWSFVLLLPINRYRCVAIMHHHTTPVSSLFAFSIFLLIYFSSNHLHKIYHLSTKIINQSWVSISQFSFKTIILPKSYNQSLGKDHLTWANANLLDQYC